MPVSDIGFYEFRRQLQYKAKLTGAELVIASRWFPSSKMYSVCGRVADELPLSVREWTCQCGAVHDREINGATNLCRYQIHRASCTRINTCGEEGSGAGYSQRETGLAEAGISHVLFGHGLNNGDRGFRAPPADNCL